ncbi:hypothetical protein Dimus_035568, partial [Dionaea muscipula]
CSSSVAARPLPESSALVLDTCTADFPVPTPSASPPSSPSLPEDCCAPSADSDIPCGPSTCAADPITDTTTDFFIDFPTYARSSSADPLPSIEEGFPAARCVPPIYVGV